MRRQPRSIVTNRFASRWKVALPVDADNIAADIIQSPRIANGQANTCSGNRAISNPATMLKRLRMLTLGCSTLFRIRYWCFNMRCRRSCCRFPPFSIWSLGNAEQIEWITLRSNGTLEDWQVSGDQLETVVQHLHMLDAVSSSLLRLRRRYKVAAREFKAASFEIAMQSNCDTESFSSQRVPIAILAGRVLPWCDLRRDKLAMRDPLRRDRSILRAACVWRLVCSLCSYAALSCGKRTNTIRLQNKPSGSIAELFPKCVSLINDCRTAILARIKSEHTKAKGVRKSDPAAAYR